MAPLQNEEYTVGWVCALPLEMAAAREMLDEKHGKPETQHDKDNNSYYLGSIGKHNIVIACLPTGIYGTTSAAVVADQMLFSFPSIRFGLLVGVGGGIPRKGHDIRLGDIVVSKPEGTTGGLIQYDYGKTIAGGKFERTGSLDKPPLVLLAAVSSVQAEHELENYKVPNYLSAMLANHKSAKFIADWSYPGAQNDNIYDANYEHAVDNESCKSCNDKKILTRSDRDDENPVVHYGIIATGNKVIKHARTRDQMGEELGAICFEMEAAGLTNHFPCIVVRGICDYSDSHKNKRWQRYAAAAAAGYAKELLGEVASKKVEMTQTVVKALKINHHRKEVLNWLCEDDYSPRHSTLFSEHQVGTGQWLKDSPQFKAWLGGHSKSKTLFCPGIPGSGKTMIASIVIDYLIALKKERRADDGIGVAFLYCDYSRHSKQTSDALLVSLLRQLVEQLSSIPEAIGTMYKNCNDSHRRPQPDEMDAALLTAVRCYSEVFIIVDALDESTDIARNGLISQIRTLQEQSKTRLMATSRPIFSITDEFKNDDKLEIEAHSEDIERYLDGNVSRLPSFVLKKPILMRDVKKGIIDAVKGMFLLARLHLDSLADEISEKTIKSTLEKLPRGEKELGKAYEAAVRRIESQPPKHRELAKKVLFWIIHGQRHFFPTELQQALAVEPSDKEFEESALPDIKIIVSSCVGLVSIDEKSNVIRLVHYTTQQHFQKVIDTWIQDAPAAIARTCLTYLSFHDFATGFCRSYERLQVRLARYTFLCYAATHWAKHAHMVQTEVKEKALSFLKRTKLTSASYQAMKNSPKWYGEIEPENVTGLHLAVSFDLRLLLLDLLNENGDVDQKDSRGRTPLHWAAQLGLKSISELLLQQKADVAATDATGWTALHYAAKGGHDDLALLLIENKSDVNIESRGHWTSLQIAAREGHEGVVRLLLKNGAAVNEGSKENSLYPSGWPESSSSFLGRHRSSRFEKEKLRERINEDVNEETALNLAIRNAHGSIVRLLLENGAQFDKKKDLFNAASNGDLVTVMLLIERGADVELMDKSEYRHGMTALHHAAQSGHEAVARFLIENGADVERKEWGKSPLHCAALSGCEAVARLLVEKGADVNARYHDRRHQLSGATPLHFAARTGSCDIIQFLLEQKADSTAIDGEGKTAFDDAVKFGRIAVVQLLIEKTMNVEGKTWTNELLKLVVESREEAMARMLIKRCFSAQHGPELQSALNSMLWSAIRRGNSSSKALVQSLLKNRADANMEHENSSALHLAIGVGDRAVIQLLLDHNADLCAKGHKGRTALHLAASDRKELIVQLLLEYPGDVDARDDFEETALHIVVCSSSHKSSWESDEALSRERDAILELLLEHNADINASNKNQETPLHHAIGAYSPSIPLVEFLLDHGALTNKKNCRGQTVLHISAGKGNEKVLSLILENEPDINTVDKNQRTALHEAAEYGSGKIIQLLLNQQALVDMKNNRGRTALHLAVRRQDELAVSLLLEYGADVDVGDDSCRTALYYAKTIGHKGIVKLLQNYDAKEFEENSSHLEAQDQRLVVVRQLIACGTDINVKDSRGWTELHRAAEDGYEEVVRLLLESGAQANLKTKEGYTPLELAAYYQWEAVMQLLVVHYGQLVSGALKPTVKSGNEALVRLLLENGVAVDSSSLECAAKGGHDRILRMLLDHNHIISIHGKSIPTVLLHSAAMAGQESTMMLLLKLNPDINAKMDVTHYGSTALHEAAKKGSMAAVRLLLEHKADVNAKAFERRTPLHEAILNKRDAVVRLLLENGADTTAKAGRDELPLHSAARWGTEDSLQALLEYGAADDIALYEAADSGRVDKVRILLQHVNVNSLPYGTSALHRAALLGYEAVARLLLDYKVNVNILDSDGKTPLHNAAWGLMDDKSSQVAIMRLLMEHGAEVNAKAKDGATPLFKAADRGQNAAAQLLLQYKAVDTANIDGETALHRATAKGHRAIVQQMLESGLDVHVKGSSGKVALHRAAEGGSETVVRLLLENQSDIQAKDYFGKTAFHYAAEKGHEALIPILIQHNSSIINEKAANGHTALHLAVINEHLAVIQRLLEYKVDVNMKDYSGRTVFHYAVENLKTLAIIEILLDNSVDVHSEGNDGKTALDRIKYPTDYETVLKLIQSRA